MSVDINEQKKLFLEICNDKIHREGMDKLLDWLEKSDFYRAPASTKYHGAYEGGLCEHSLDVLEQALKLVHFRYCLPVPRCLQGKLLQAGQTEQESERHMGGGSLFLCGRKVPLRWSRFQVRFHPPAVH